MIIDCIGNHTLYPLGPAWEAAFDFMKTVQPEMENKKYIIQGDRLFAIADSYHTKARDAGKLETHRKYVDIQMLVSGSETLEVFPKHELSVSEPHNSEKDAEFYHIPAEHGIKINLTPGRFAVFFPEDAHMPCIMTGNSPQPVKKIVIKFAVDLLQN